jgi:hypothetical protein
MANSIGPTFTSQGRQNINLGTNANDGTGDNLRDAMQKINDNLIELFARTGGDEAATTTNIGFAGNIIGISGDLSITTNNLGNLTIDAPTYLVKDTFLTGNVKINTNEVDPNFKVISSGNMKIKGSVTIGEDSLVDRLVLNSYITGTITPSFNLAYDLGTTSLRYKDVFVGGAIDTNSIYTAGANINGGTINNTFIGLSNPSEGRFSILRADDSFLGELLVRNNQISTNSLNTDIEIKPNGTGNVYVSTKLIVGAGTTPMVNPVLQATGNADTFTQIGVQNKSNGKFACSDIVIFTNEGSDFYNFCDIGQNNTNWDGSLQYIYFDSSSEAFNWEVGHVVVQYDLDGSTILARGIIDENILNPLNNAEVRIRVCKIFEGTTGIFEEGTTYGDVVNENDFTFATPKDHLLETITSTGEAKYSLGTHTLNDSTARAAFAPTVALAADSVEVKVDGVLQEPGVDFTIQFDKILFYKIPAVGKTITIRQFPDANYPFTIGQSGDSYMYNNGSKLTIGTMTGHDVIFHVNGVRYTAEAGRIKGHSKNWILGNGVTSKNGFDDTGETLQVHGPIKTTENTKGGVTEGNITIDFTLMPTKKIYSYTPTRDDVIINLETSMEKTVGSVVIFNNRSTTHNYNLFDASTSSFIISIEPNTAHSLACDSSGWFVVSTI